MEILSAFIVGFVAMWIATRIDYTKSSNLHMKDNMIEVANAFCKNDKICKEIQNYSFDQIKNGSFEYIEVIEKLKQNKNDKT